MFYRGAVSSLKRYENYMAKVRAFSGTGAGPDYTAPVIQQKLSSMYRSVQEAFIDQFGYQTQVASLLASHGEPLWTRASYQAFANQLYKMCRVMQGQVLAGEVAALIAVWIERGLDTTALTDIATNIFGVPAVIP